MADGASEGVIANLINMDQHLVVHCQGCDHQMRFTPQEACRLFGAGSTLSQARSRMKCHRCQSTGGEGMIDMRPCMKDYYARLHFEEAKRNLEPAPNDPTARQLFELRQKEWERRRPKEPSSARVIDHNGSR